MISFQILGVHRYVETRGLLGVAADSEVVGQLKVESVFRKGIGSWWISLSTVRLSLVA